MFDMRYPFNIEIGSINTFILMIKGDDNRHKQTKQFPSGMINMIKFLESVYGKVLWKNIIISVSDWGYGSFDIADRRDVYQSEVLLTHHWNNILNETFQVEHDVPLLFVDSYFTLQTMKDEKRKEKYETEISKLWKFVNESNVIKSFRRQKRELSSQVESLNEIISNNTADAIEKLSDIELIYKEKSEELVKENKYLKRQMEEIDKSNKEFKQKFNKFEKIIQEKTEKLEKENTQSKKEMEEIEQKLEQSEKEIRDNKEKTEKLVKENIESKQKMEEMHKVNEELKQRVARLENKFGK